MARHDNGAELAAMRRYDAEPYAELRVAAAEQMKITELRLAKLLQAAGSQPRGHAGHAAGAVEQHPVAGVASETAAASSQWARVATLSIVEQADKAIRGAAAGYPAEAAQAAAARRSGRLRAHFPSPRGDGHGAVLPSQTAGSPGVSAAAACCVCNGPLPNFSSLVG